jgi:Ca2+-dependent lipid-binding protein
MNHLFCKIDFSSFYFDLFVGLFSNHLKGQDTLHIDIYDEDTVEDEIIGSIQIDLLDLYQRGFYKKFSFLFVDCCVNRSY